MLKSCLRVHDVGDCDPQAVTQVEVQDRYQRCLRANSGRLILEGIIARADIVTKNSRIYPEAVLRREVAKYVSAHVSNGTAFGELDHPDCQSCYYRALNLPNVSHRVLSARWVRQDVWGLVEVLQTPSGRQVMELYAEGLNLGMSLRGWAAVDASSQTVAANLKLITFDIVAKPAQDTYLVPVTRRQIDGPCYSLAACCHGTSACNETVREHVVQLAQLGYGSVPMKRISQLPAVGHVIGMISAARECAELNKLASQAASYWEGSKMVCTNQDRAGTEVLHACGLPIAATPAPEAIPRYLTQGSLCSHYLVSDDGMCLHEPHARRYVLHKASVVKKARKHGIP